MGHSSSSFSPGAFDEVVWVKYRVPRAVVLPVVNVALVHGSSMNLKVYEFVFVYVTEVEVVESSIVYVVATVNVRSLYPTIYDES